MCGHGQQQQHHQRCVLSNDKMKLSPNVNPPCKYCQNVPCLLEDGLYELIVQYEEELRENDSTLTNKEISFYLYCDASRWIHGYLGKRNCITLSVFEVRSLILPLSQVISTSDSRK
jgi:hypothetical protein